MTAEKLGFGIKWLVRRLGSKLFSGSPKYYMVLFEYTVYCLHNVG